MLARLRKSQENNEGGFTLIELLVVMIIIGILAAIAIPTFLNQKKKAKESSLKADVKSISVEIESALTDGTPASMLVAANGAITAGAVGAEAAVASPRLSNGNSVADFNYTAATGAYCVEVANTDTTVTHWKVTDGQLASGTCD